MTIFKYRFTQNREDALDLRRYKKIHLGPPVFSKKIWKKLKSF